MLKAMLPKLWKWNKNKTLPFKALLLINHVRYFFS